MGQPEDIDKLLREIDALNAASPLPDKGAAPAPTPGAPGSAPLERPRQGRSTRAVWTATTAAGGLLGGGAVGTFLSFLPYVSTASTAVGAALGAAMAGLVSGPPPWFRRR